MSADDITSERGCSSSSDADRCSDVGRKLLNVSAAAADSCEDTRGIVEADVLSRSRGVSLLLDGRCGSGGGVVLALERRSKAPSPADRSAVRRR